MPRVATEVRHEAGVIRVYDSENNIILEFDGDSREVTIPAGSNLVVAGIDFGNIPTTDPEDSVTVWNDGGVLKVAGAGG